LFFPRVKTEFVAEEHMMTPPPAPRRAQHHDNDEAEALAAPTPLLAREMDADMDLGGLKLLLEATEQTSPFKEEVGGSGGSSSPEQGPRIPVSRVAFALEAAARVAAQSADNSPLNPSSSSSRRSVEGNIVMGKGGRGRKSTEKALAAAAAAAEECKAKGGSTLAGRRGRRTAPAPLRIPEGRAYRAGKSSAKSTAKGSPGGDDVGEDGIGAEAALVPALVEPTAIAVANLAAASAVQATLTWLDMVWLDTKGRLAAVRRSQRRVQRSLQMWTNHGSERPAAAAAAASAAAGETAVAVAATAATAAAADAATARTLLKGLDLALEGEAGKLAQTLADVEGIRSTCGAAATPKRPLCGRAANRERARHSGDALSFASPRAAAAASLESGAAGASASASCSVVAVAPSGGDSTSASAPATPAPLTKDRQKWAAAAAMMCTAAAAAHPAMFAPPGAPPPTTPGAATPGGTAASEAASPSPAVFHFPVSVWI
jgi:hypothetical protein